jgi:hypothetical protein
MSLFSFFKKSGAPVLPPLKDLHIDVLLHACANMRVGQQVPSKEGFITLADEAGVVKDDNQGFEACFRDGMLESVFIDLAKFPGIVCRNGEQFESITSKTEAETLAFLGEPYHRDEDDDEVILFYEDGTVETQFEFPGRARLRYITISANPLLADPLQRAQYGCTKPWRGSAS